MGACTPFPFPHSSTLHLGKASTVACAQEALRRRFAAMPALAHDERKAPGLLLGSGMWDETTALSLSDENGWSACLVATAQNGLVGLGIDLCSLSDFAAEKHRDVFFRRAFSSEELRYVGAESEADAHKAAVLFSAKESAFKATSRAVRIAAVHENKSVHFTMLDFEIIEIESGIFDARPIKQAAGSFEALGIDRIEVFAFSETPEHPFVITAAYALSDCNGKNELD